jgi:hypothetical protein
MDWRNDAARNAAEWTDANREYTDENAETTGRSVTSTGACGRFPKPS